MSTEPTISPIRDDSSLQPISNKTILDDDKETSTQVSPTVDEELFKGNIFPSASSAEDNDRPKVTFFPKAKEDEYYSFETLKEKLSAALKDLKLNTLAKEANQLSSFSALADFYESKRSTIVESLTKIHAGMVSGAWGIQGGAFQPMSKLVNSLNRNLKTWVEEDTAKAKATISTSEETAGVNEAPTLKI